MLKKIIDWSEKQKITAVHWMIGLSAIFFVRLFFESLSAPASTGVIPTDAYTIVNYLLFFSALNLGLIYVIGYFTKEYWNVGKFLLFIFPIIWIAPIVDIVISAGDGYTMGYIYDYPKNLLVDFIKFPTFQKVAGITYGMHATYTIFLFLIGYYVNKKTKSISKTFLSVFFSYVLMFILGSAPSLFYAFEHIRSEQTISVISYIKSIPLTSDLYHNTARDVDMIFPESRFLELGFNKLLSRAFYIISFIFLIIIFWKAEKQKFIYMLKNCRPERIVYYLIPFFFATGFAYISGVGGFMGWVDAMGILCLLLSWLGVWIYSVHVNDIYDIEIDKISNTKRPLVQNQIDTNDMSDIGYVFMALALAGSWSAGFYPFFMASVGIAIAYIYSAPPLRLRRFPIVSTFLMSIVVLCATLSGFFLVSIDKTIESFPIFVAMGIIVIFTLQINFKDMKDIEGDTAQGIMTLPVIFKKNGDKIVGICFALSFLLTPIFLSFYTLYIFAIPISILGYFAITKKPYKENRVFILIFSFATAIALMFLTILYLSKSLIT